MVGEVTLSLLCGQRVSLLSRHSLSRHDQYWISFQQEHADGNYVMEAMLLVCVST